MALFAPSALPYRQHGSAAVEFALLFVVQFMLLYGLVGLTVPLLLASSYQDLASNSLRYAVELQARSTDDMDYAAKVQERIASSWLPERWLKSCNGASFLDTGNAAVGSEVVWRVCIRHDNPAAIIPPINLFGLSIPPLPDEIRGEAAIRLR